MFRADPIHRTLLSVTALCLLCCLALAGTGRQAAAASPDDREWVAFRAKFLTPDGRIVDTGNAGVTHSEGQGYGMLLAAYYGDRPAFDLIRTWTERNLRRSEDRLAPWLYDPGANPPIKDQNNATDGDLFIAWALARGGERWHESGYTARAIAITADILRNCVVEYGGRKILLPGTQGFRRKEGTVLNLSYYAFAPMHALARLVPDPLWARLESDGLAIMRAAHFGPWGLPPDWVLLTPEGKFRPAEGWPARFSYDAVRIPLNLSWVQLPEPALKAAVAMWTAKTLSVRAPAWVSLDGSETADYAIGPGVRAILQVGLATLARTQPAAMPSVDETSDYYQASLMLLSRMAAAEPGAPLPPPAPERRPRSASLWSPITAAFAASSASEADVPSAASIVAASGEAPVRAVAASRPLVAENPFPDAAPFARPAWKNR